METTKVTVDEVRERMKRGEPFTFIDTRNPKAWGEADEKLPGALRVPADEVANHLAEIPRDRVIITYCTWPNEGSSARVAQELMERGYKNVHPLYGGFNAWRDASAPLEAKQKEQKAGIEWEIMNLINAIRQNTHPLKGVAEDSDPLMEGTGNGRCVLLGEASHGTHEFYRGRAQITKRHYDCIALNAL
jgi:rhodanese-related sulfurtransferase